MLDVGTNNQKLLEDRLCKLMLHFLLVYISFLDKFYSTIYSNLTSTFSHWITNLHMLLVTRRFYEDIYSCYFSLIDLGLRQPRLEGEEYLAIVDEFMEAVYTRWPKAVVQVYFFLKFGFLVMFFPLLVWWPGGCPIASVWRLSNEVGFWNTAALSQKVLYVQWWHTGNY